MKTIDKIGTIAIIGGGIAGMAGAITDLEPPRLAGAGIMLVTAFLGMYRDFRRDMKELKGIENNYQN